MAELTEDRQRHLIALASEAVNRVREIDPERNGTWIDSLTADDRRDLIITLAAMVDPETPLPIALAWTWELAR